MAIGATNSSGPEYAREALIDELDQRLRRPLVNNFEKRIWENSDVDDLVQEVFIRLSRRDTLNEIDFLEAYVFETAANVMRDRIRDLPHWPRCRRELVVRAPGRMIHDSASHGLVHSLWM
jgi:DNA-directed RNA polymerase specialized sigma24 family protein